MSRVTHSFYENSEYNRNKCYALVPQMPGSSYEDVMGKFERLNSALSCGLKATNVIKMANLASKESMELFDYIESEEFQIETFEEKYRSADKNWMF